MLAAGACGDDGGGAGGGGPSTCQVAAQCDDGDPCSIDRCGDEGLCAADPAPTGVAPEQEVGDCQQVFCEDGRARYVEDTFDVEDDLESCTIDRCDGDRVVHTPLDEGASCEVGRGSGTCQDETCIVPCTATTAATACDDLNPCTQDGCIGEGPTGVCKHGVFSGPTPGANQNVGNCHEQRCVEGVDTDVVDDFDVPDDGNDCTQDSCVAGTPLIEPASAGTSCEGDYVCDGDGICVQCLSVADCPALGAGSTCYVPACEQGQCIQGYAELGTPLPPDYQYEGDCAFNVCDGFGSTTGQPEPDDLPNDQNPCTADSCSGASPLYELLDPGTPCGSGRVCDELGSCCQPYDCDQFGAECGTIDNGCGETIQCGGCDGTDTCEGNVCCGAPRTCDEMGKNCGPFTGCGQDLDCGECDAGDTCGVSVANECGCTDGIQNQGETGVDCGGPCLQGCGEGSPCGLSGECASGFCFDSVCCDVDCSGTCRACVESKTGSPDGTCDAVTTGSDPDAECTADPVPSCDRTGFCEAGACQLQPAATECGPSSCVGNLEVSADACNGTGTCVDSGSVTCGGTYICAGDSCQSCSDNVINGTEVDVDCGGGAPCAGCGPGSPCPNGGTDCANGLCVDGVCCESTCTGLCVSCGLAGTEGTCSPRPPGADPDAECPGNQSCNGSGSCN